MGGMFGGGPSLPEPKPAPVLPDPKELERKAREEIAAKRRRGRAGLIATSPRGLLDAAQAPTPFDDYQSLIS